MATDVEFVGQINTLVRRCYENSKDHGFWDGLDVNANPHAVAVKLMLITSEVAEAMEADRNTDGENLREELADICIRVFDLAGALGFNLEQSIIHKMKVNEGRPRMHGGKRY